MKKRDFSTADPAAAETAGTEPKARKGWYLAAAYFLPLAIMYLIYIGMELWPFGKNSVLVLDLNGQYVYYFEYFREIIHGNASLLYSWTRSLGGEFLGIFAYYLCSPFSLIVALLPAAWMTEALLTLILSKVGMCGLCMAFYLRHARHTGPYTSVLFGTMYALCAYGVIQSMNTMWIDAMYLLPIVLYGCERLIEGKHPALYCITLTVLFLTNYYIGFMVCVFLVLYFFYYSLSQDDTRVSSFVKAGLRFALYSLLAAAMAAILLIPAYYGLTFGKTEFQQTNYDFFQRFDFLDFLAKLLPCSYDTVRPEGLPVVYSGLLTLLFVPLYFITPGIGNRRKVWSGVLVTALVMSMNMSTVDIFWHGLSKPNWLNYRYSFMLCFVLIAMAAEAFSRFDCKTAEKDHGVRPIAFKSLLTVGLALFALIVMIQKEDYEFLDDMLCIWVSLAFLGAYFCALHPLSCGVSRGAGRAAVMVLCCAELFVAGLADMDALDHDVVFSDRQPYADFIGRFRPAADAVLAQDDGLYRMEKTVHRKVNDNMALRMRGISHSTSDLNASVIKFLGQLGYSSRSHWSKYLGGTPVSDALLGIKYIIAEESVSDLYEETLNTDDLLVYENPYAAGILYTVSDGVLSYDMEDTTTPFRRMNDLVTEMLGEEERIELFKPIPIDDISYFNCDYGFTTGHKKYSPEEDGKSCSLTYRIFAPGEDEIFVYFPSDWAREVDLFLNGEDWGTYFGNETRRIVSLGSFMAKEPVTLQLKLTEDDLYIGTGVDYFWTLDEDLYREIMPRLQAQSMQIDRWKDTRIEGTVTTSKEAPLLFTTIPYDEGWMVEVDGEPVEITRTLGALLSADLSGLPFGEHTVTLHYMPRCYVYGACISGGGLVLFLLCLLFRSMLRRRVLADGTESVSDDPTSCMPLEELLAAVEAEEQQAQSAVRPEETLLPDASAVPSDPQTQETPPQETPDEKAAAPAAPQTASPEETAAEKDADADGTLSAEDVMKEFFPE